MKAFKKPVYMLASHEVAQLPGSLISNHPFPSSLVAKDSSGILKKKNTFISKLLRKIDIFLEKLQGCLATSHAKIQRAVSTQTVSIVPRTLVEQETNKKERFLPETEWVPLIKGDIVSEPKSHQELTRLLDDARSLAGQAILCVGGRAALYPDYFRLVTAAGGHFMIYRGSTETYDDQFYSLLERASMVICPVDCVSHETYFAVKRYCKLTGKSCAFLQRSSLPAFTRGLANLILQLHGDTIS